MKRKKLLLLFVSTCLILALAVSPFMAACAPAVEPGAAEVAALQKEVAALEKEVTAAEKKASTSEKEVAASEKEIASLEGKVAAAEKEIAKLEAAAPEPVEVIEWKCQNYFPGGIPWFEITARCDDYIEEMSGGRLVITSYPEEALIPTAEIATAVGKGTVEMGMTCGGYHMGLIPVAAFEGAQPMAMGGPHRDYFFIDYGGADIVRRAYAEHNIYWTFCYDDTQALLMTTVPVRTVADLEGLKLRSYGASSRMWDGLGAETEWVPGGEIYMGLQTGVFDGAHYMGPFAMYELGFHEVCPYILIEPPAYYAGDGANLVNLDAWNSLTEDLQAIIMTATMDTANEHRRYAEAMDDIYLAKMVSEWGVTKSWWSEEDIAIAQEVATEVWWYFAQADDYSMEFYELMMDFMREIGRID